MDMERPRVCQPIQAMALSGLPWTMVADTTIHVIPLLSDSSQVGKWIGRNNSIHISLGQFAHLYGIEGYRIQR
jgi:hypothetical protein